MTKKRSLLLILLAIFCLFFTYWLRPTKNPEEAIKAPEVPKEEAPAPHEVDVDQLKVDGRKVIGLAPGREKKDIQDLKVANSPSPHWKENLEKTLRAQGGSGLTEITIKKVDSFVWKQDGVALYVESALVTVKNDQNRQTSFRVLSDAETGKILKNWDQPVFDPANPRDNFRLKLDPRYHAE